MLSGPICKLRGPLMAGETDAHRRTPSIQGENRCPRYPPPYRPPQSLRLQVSEPSPGCKSHSSGKRTARGNPAPFLSLRLQPCLGPPSDPRLTEPNSSRRQWAPPEKTRADRGLRRGAGAGRAGHRRFPGEVSEPAADIFCLFHTGWWLAVGQGFSAR
ncbi:unnamed protein product [Rangifer tarandus platyrhynchus]|uniref:Uncharacterized protein n=3 Tax=Rangifer tarandus platyrhynchus TaxID=3082113 RepID=A0ABN8ZN52_RANTA|nr:unnamed protein product [Rangifer tarandus platyrhynchus]